MKNNWKFWMIPQASKGLSAQARILLGVLYTFSNGHNKAWPSQKLLAEEVGVSIRQIQRCLKELIDSKWIIETEKRGYGKTNQYTLNEDKNVAIESSNSDTHVAFNSDTHVASNIDKIIDKINIHANDTSVSSAEIDDFSPTPQRISELIQLFRKINPMLPYENRTQRSACTRLIKERGYERARGAAEICVEAAASGNRFAPIITSPNELIHKYGKLIAYADRNP
jgi:hypothetical protein